MKYIKLYLPTLIGILIGIGAGYLYYDYKSCANGTCLITSKPLITIVYGALVGGLIGNLFQKNKPKSI